VAFVATCVFFFFFFACRVAKRAKKYNCGKKLFFLLQQILPKTQIKEAVYYGKEIWRTGDYLPGAVPDSVFL
jgi:hypothetical protein